MNGIIIIGLTVFTAIYFNAIEESNQYKKQAYCESLYMTNQVEMMYEEGCNIPEIAESINRTKRGE